MCAGQRAEGELPRHLTSRAEAAAHHAELHTTLLNAKLKRERVARVCTKCPRPHGRSSRGEHSSQSPSAREAPDKPSPRARGTGGLRVSNRVPHCLAVAVSEMCQKLSKICRKSVVLSKICRKSVVRDQPTRPGTNPPDFDKLSLFSATLALETTAVEISEPRLGHCNGYLGLRAAHLSQPPNM